MIHYVENRVLTADIPGIGRCLFEINNQGTPHLRILNDGNPVETWSLASIKTLQDFLNRAMELKAPGA